MLRPRQVGAALRVSSPAASWLRGDGTRTLLGQTGTVPTGKLTKVMLVMEIVILSIVMQFIITDISIFC